MWSEEIEKSKGDHVHWCFLSSYESAQALLAHFLCCKCISFTRIHFCFQVVREDKKKVISFASELKKLTSRSRSMTTGSGVDGPAQSKDDRAACCVALTELQEWGSHSACRVCMEKQQRYRMSSLTSNIREVELSVSRKNCHYFWKVQAEFGWDRFKIVDGL